MKGQKGVKVMGWIYSLLMPSTGLLKIGGTRLHPEMRRYQEQQRFGVPLVVCFSMQHDRFREIERHTHRRLKSHRIKDDWPTREWYETTPQEVFRAVNLVVADRAR